MTDSTRPERAARRHVAAELAVLAQRPVLAGVRGAGVVYCEAVRWSA